MKQLLHLSSFLFCLSFCSVVYSQNILITYQKSDALFVCGTDSFFVQIKNTGALPIVAATLKVTLPAGVTYQAGSITGALEQNIANLAAPVFVLTTLPIGGVISTTILLHADCAAAEALDAGQVFVADLQVVSPQGSAQVLTSSFAIETGLLLIDSVDHVLLTGSRGDTLFRKIWVRNTRLGKIGGLHFEDAHQLGLVVNLPGATTQTPGTTFSEAEFDGSFFTAFGDGDSWLEFGETACFIEQITITDCGIPAFTNPSVLRVGWGCGGEICRYDSLLVSTMIETSTKVPDLHFTPFWKPPVSNCADVTSTMRLKIKNEGGAEAENLLMNLKAIDALLYGMDAASFRLVFHGDTIPLAPSVFTTQHLPDCDADVSGAVSLLIAKIAAQDSVDLLFDTYYCLPACSQTFGTFVADYFYRKRCPVDGFVSDTLVFTPDADYLIAATSKFFVGGCLQDGGTYPMHYSIKSKRLEEAPGILHIDLVLPWGFTLDSNCPLLLGGIAPTSVVSNPISGQPNRVQLAFQLPLSADSLSMDFCLHYDCRDSMDCHDPASIVLPPSGGEFAIDVDPSNSCDGNKCYLP